MLPAGLIKQLLAVVPVINNCIVENVFFDAFLPEGSLFQKKRIKPLHYSSIPYHLTRNPSSVFVICRDRYASASPVSAWPPNS